MSNQFMTIDGIPVEINGEKNLLDLIHKVGIDMPTFCYHSDLSVYGACRMCMVENERGMLVASCSEPPRAGMMIRTNTERLRKYRKNILELLLANHCRDCTTCEYSNNCRLQELALRFDIKGVRFPNTKSEPLVDDSSACIVRDTNKCILCGDCVRMCNEVQGVGAIDFAFRGSKMMVGPAFNRPLAESPCVGCGQCAAVCPTGALIVRNDANKVWKALDDKDLRVSVQVAPAVRVALGEAFGLPKGADSMGRIVAALRRLGFAEVFDTSTSADLTVLEEANEFVGRMQKGEKLPLFTSCCPGWIQYCEKNYPQLLDNLSTCRSPMQMFASIVKAEAKEKGIKDYHVAIMPCTAKKFEAGRDEFKMDGNPNVDAVLTTQELIRMIKESGLRFNDLEPEAVDMPYGIMTGAGVIFGVTGGVTEAVLRYASADKSAAAREAIRYSGVRGMEGVKEAKIPFGEGELRIAVVSGLANTGKLIDKILAGEVQYDLVEVMACPGGCVNGGGQPHVDSVVRAKRAQGLYAADKMCSIRTSEQNPVMDVLYQGVLKDRAHELLHVHYHK